MLHTVNAGACRRPHFNYQYQKQRIWKASFPWSSIKGDCTEIRMNPDQTFDVQVCWKGQSIWMPVAAVLNESEVRRWLHRCNVVLKQSEWRQQY